METLLGTTIDQRYAVECQLGAGAMGAVYRVKHLSLDKPFAMKVIHEQLNQNDQFVARFEREARALSKLNHPNIISVTDFGRTPEGTFYLITEFADGGTLHERLQRPLELSEAFELFDQLLTGLAHAHQASIVHRDIKPENILLQKSGRSTPQVKITDFGLAKLVDTERMTQLTQAGTAFGTPAYMAPEQATGQSITAAADVYAAGSVLWHMLLGQPPFVGDVIQILAAKAAQSSPSFAKAARGRFEEPLCNVIEISLSRDVDNRYADAVDFQKAFESALNQPTISAAESPQATLAYGQRPSADLAEPAHTPNHAAYAKTELADTIAAETSSQSSAAVQKLTSLVRQSSMFILARPYRALKLSACALGVVILGVMFFGRGYSAPEIEAVAEVKPTGRLSKIDKQEIKATRALLLSGECGEAKTSLAKIRERHPEHPVTHYLLGRLRFCEKAYSQALTHYRRAVQKNADYMKDQTLLENIESLLRRKANYKEVIAFLSEDGGENGIAILAKAAVSRIPKLRHTAVAALTRMGREDVIDFVASLSLDLSHDEDCNNKKRLIARLVDLDSPRVVVALKRARAKRENGFLGVLGARHNDCVQDDLRKAIQQLETLFTAEEIKRASQN